MCSRRWRSQENICARELERLIRTPYLHHFIAWFIRFFQLCLFDIRRTSSSIASSSPSARPVAPVLTFSHHTNAFERYTPCMDSNETYVYCGGRNGKVRSWAIQTGELLMDQQVIDRRDGQSSSSSSSSSLPFLRHLLSLDNFSSILAGSELGLSSLNLNNRT